MPETLRNNQAALPKAWPFEEAAKVAARLDKSGKAAALFETGYGPSGLPHIGTFGEVARTSWVRHAFTVLTGRTSRLIAFSDDMDGLRRVPDNVPNRDMLGQYLGRPLTRVPDPFGTHDSFGAHNNARLRSFLDSFGFDYEFASSTDYYAAGRFDAALIRVLETFDEVMAVILPTLGPDRRATYSPILPLHPRTGIVMQVPIAARDPVAGTVTWCDPDTSEMFETSVKGGACKLQWKADWAMRWYALGVDYEMSGKDLIDSVRLSSRICRILGAPPPETLTYELFLDENGQRISKSKGNGLPVEEWLRYAPQESLGQFMYNAPHRAKRLHFDVIPRAVDEYLANAARLPTQPESERPTNPAWHIHAGRLPNHAGSPVSFAMLLNLASVVNADTSAMLWGFIRRYAPGASPETMPFLDKLVDHAVAYYRDFVRPEKRYRHPTDIERAALADLAETLRGMHPGGEKPASGGVGGVTGVAGVAGTAGVTRTAGVTGVAGTAGVTGPTPPPLEGGGWGEGSPRHAVGDLRAAGTPPPNPLPQGEGKWYLQHLPTPAYPDGHGANPRSDQATPAGAAHKAEKIQNLVYEVGKRHDFPELRAWFACLYQVLLGQQEGPRFGGFIALYGVAETIALIEAALTRPVDAA